MISIRLKVENIYIKNIIVAYTDRANFCCFVNERINQVKSYLGTDLTVLAK